MMEPISIALATVTFVSFFKEIINLGQKIRDCVDKPGQNRKRLCGLTDDILNVLADLENCYKRREHVLDSSAELLNSLDGLRTEMRHVLEHCLRDVPTKPGGRIATAKAEFKAWKNRTSIEAEITRLKDRVQACHLRFTTVASARIEHAVLVLDNEQRVRLNRMENMVLRLMVDTQVDFSRVGEFKSLGGSDYEDIPHQYLRLQVRDIVDSLKKLAASGSFATEEPEGIYLRPIARYGICIPRSDDLADQHREVVAEALRILRLLQDDREKLSIQNGAMDMLRLSGSLHDLGMWEDAEVTCTWAANLYRTLVRGNVNSFLPYLAMTLDNLAVYRHSIHDYKGTLAASKESVEAYRLLKDTQILHDVACSLAGALGNHARALNLLGYFKDGLAAAQESVFILRGLVAGELETKSMNTSHDLDSDSELEEMSNDSGKIPILELLEESPREPAAINDLIMLAYNLGIALRCLSVCLANTDDGPRAYDAADEALQIFRYISNILPGIFEGSLAEILYHTSDRLSDINLPLDALPLIEEAVDIYRNLAPKRPTTFAVDLVRALCKSTALLRRAGRDDDALAAGDEAIRAYRGLVADHPNLVHHLPNAFQDIRSHLMTLGRGEEALTLTTEAADTYRTLVTNFPSLMPSFADMLHVLAWQLNREKRLEDARVVGKEAVNSYRNLVKDNPVAYSPYLASSLATLARSFYASKRYDEGIEAGKEAMEIYRTASKSQPDLQSVFLEALKALWFAYGEAKRLKDSVAIGAEVIHVYRTISKDRPADFATEFAELLLNHSNDLYRSRRYLEGLIADEEAVNLYRSFEGDEFACGFVEAVNSFAIGLYDVGRIEQAVEVVQEAISVCRKIISDNPQITSTRISLLANFSDCRRFQGRFNEAVLLNEEAVSLSRGDSSKDPSDLARELRELSVSLLNVGRLQDALRASEEAVELCRSLPQSEDVSPTLAYSLDSLASCLAIAGREEDAFAAAKEAVTLYRQMTPNSRLTTGFYDHNVADAIYNLAARLAAAECPAEALTNTREAASIYRTVVTTRAGYLPKFATVLRSLSVRLWETGHQEEAINAWKEEADVRRRVALTNPDHTPMLYDALNELCSHLFQMNRIAEASAINVEARKVRDEHPGLFGHLPALCNVGSAGDGVLVIEAGEDDEKELDENEVVELKPGRPEPSDEGWSFNAMLRATIMVPFLQIWFSLFDFWIVVTWRRKPL